MNICSESGAKPTVNIREAAVSEETRQAQDEKNRRGSGSSHSLNLTEAKSSKSKSLGDQVNRHPGVCIGEKLLDDAVDREASPNTSTSGSHHSNQEETSQHCDNQARKARPGELGKEMNSIPCIAKSEDCPHRRNEEMAQRRRRHDRADRV